jgi:hypothetical protein
MIIEHEDNPSWLVPSSPPQQPRRVFDAQPRRDIPQPRPFRPSVARTVIFGMLIVAMLAPLFMAAV